MECKSHLKFVCLPASIFKSIPDLCIDSDTILESQAINCFVPLNVLCLSILSCCKKVASETMHMPDHHQPLLFLPLSPPAGAPAPGVPAAAAAVVPAVGGLAARVAGVVRPRCAAPRVVGAGAIVSEMDIIVQR